MSETNLTDAPSELAPVASTERIQALDVIRGFALIGIFLMNIEYFNRPMGELGQGLPANATGLDWLAGFLIYVLVQGKFWTMFSLLFGMGFAVMLTRAERAQRNFFGPYLRRIAALALFGALHHIFIWGGDILFSYAVGAVGLLVLLYGSWKYILAALVVMLGLSFVPALEDLRGVCASLAFISVTAMFLRGERMSSLFGSRMPTFSLVFLALGVLVALMSLALWVMPGSAEARVPTSIMAVVLMAIGMLSARFHQPPELRTRRLGVAMYLFPFLMMTIFGAVQYYAPAAPEPSARVAGVTAKPPGAKLDAKALAADAAAAKAAEARAKAKSEQAKRKKEHEQDIAEERQIYTQGTYRQAVELRASEFASHAAGDAGFAIILVGMFLIGTWFVRSGVMENTGAHLPLFRKLALFGIPLGVGLGLVGALIATAQTPGLEKDPYQIAMGLMFIGNLPASLGYASAIVLMLHSATALARIRVLAPLGRMALTNYLTHSILGTLFFYHYGLGYWGMGRAWQVVFVAVVIFLQVLFCTWWLRHFRYGPMEWLWRVITYWKFTPISRDPAVSLDGRQVSA